MSAYNLEDLEIYRLAEAFGDEIWLVVSGWNYFAKDTVGRQLVRAADSISAILQRDMEDTITRKIKISVISAGAPLLKRRDGLTKQKTETCCRQSSLTY